MACASAVLLSCGRVFCLAVYRLFKKFSSSVFFVHRVDSHRVGCQRFVDFSMQHNYKMYMHACIRARTHSLYIYIYISLSLDQRMVSRTCSWILLNLCRSDGNTKSRVSQICLCL